MPKVKTNRAAAKRFRATGGKKVKRGAAFRRHILTSMSQKRKRQLRGSQYVSENDMKQLKALLPYI